MMENMFISIGIMLTPLSKHIFTNTCIYLDVKFLKKFHLNTLYNTFMNISRYGKNEKTLFGEINENRFVYTLS